MNDIELKRLSPHKQELHRQRAVIAKVAERSSTVGYWYGFGIATLMWAVAYGAYLLL